MTCTKKAIAVSTICGLFVLGVGCVAQSAESSVKKTVTISGQVGLGLPGVMLQGLPGTPQTDENGVYSAEVTYGWSGVVKPAKEGHTFSPASKVYRNVTANMQNEDYAASILTYGIAGSVGLSQVRLEGLPDGVVSGPDGFYSAHVPYKWSGTVTPKKTGYAFTPAARSYSDVLADRPSDDYRASIVQCRIFGRVVGDKGGVPGVRIQGPGPNGLVLTNTDGGFELHVDYGWSGTLMPVKPGYAFSPPERSIPPLTADAANLTFTANELTFTVSGLTGSAGVQMKGLPGNPITDERGAFATQVPFGWSGTVTPVREGFVFRPTRRDYQRVTADLTAENYVAQVLTYTISGTAALPGVMMQGLPENPVTDAAGFYRAVVPYGWTGAVTPTRDGCRFNPPSRPYQRVKDDLTDQNYAASVQTQGSQGFGGAGGILVIPTQQVNATDFAETREDMSVMLQILREKLSEPRTILGVLYDYGDFFGPGGRQVEALYLQGYGALFVMEVSFPLSPALAAGSADGNEPEQAVDPVWQRARQRLYAPPGATYGGRRTAAQVDQGSFEQFKEDMVKTLKHAANIRHLGADESVILTIVGQNEEPAGLFGRTAGDPYRGGYTTGGSYSSGGGYSSSGGTSTYSDSSSYGRAYSRLGTSRTVGRPSSATANTVLTLQVTKADIDAFAKGDLDFAQFSAKVKTFSY